MNSKIAKDIKKPFKLEEITRIDDMPEKITSRDGNGEYNTVFSRNIKKYFSPLRVNDMGMCDICQKYWRENH